MVSGAGEATLEGRATTRLREACAATWTDATRHRFVRELQAGTIDEGVYQAYLVQDLVFVRELVSLFGYALARAPTLESKRPFVTFLDTITSDENDHFERALDAFDVDEATRSDPPVGPVTRRFLEVMEDAATGTYAETLAVLVPVEWVYLDWATWAAQQGHPGHPILDEWIDLHANPAFERFVAHMREELDREFAGAKPNERRRVQDRFERAVELEVAFWDQAYEIAEDSSSV